MPVRTALFQGAYGIAIAALGLAFATSAEARSVPHQLPVRAECQSSLVPEMMVSRNSLGRHVSFQSIANNGTRADVMASNATYFSIHLTQSPTFSNWRGLNADVRTVLRTGHDPESVSAVRVMIDGRPRDTPWIIERLPRGVLLLRVERVLAGSTMTALETASEIEFQLLNRRGRHIATQRFDVSRFRLVLEELAKLPASC